MERIRSEELYQGRVITLRKDTIRTSGGQELAREVVAHPGAVVVVAIDGTALLFVKQFRYAANEELLELVAGGIEEGEDPAEAAGRELQEEAGFRADRLTKLGEFFSAPGFCTELLHVFLAENLSPSRLPADEDEEITLERFTLDQFLAMARSGQVRDAKTLAGVLLYAQHRTTR